MKILILILFAYIIGSIPTGLLISKFIFNKDIRNLKSKNIGATNIFRNFGYFAGIFVLLIDIFKGYISTKLLYIFNKNLKINPLIIGFFSVIGNIFSIFNNFKGGKAIATSLGILLSYQPFLFILAIIFFIIIIKLTRIVSFTNLIVSILILFCTIIIPFFFPNTIFKKFDITLTIISFLLTILIFIRHKKNIKKILKKKEKKIF